jgi:hypothetical protein
MLSGHAPPGYAHLARRGLDSPSHRRGRVARFLVHAFHWQIEKQGTYRLHEAEE